VEEFLSDPEVTLTGYQANFQHLELGLILFNHLSCHTTLGIPVAEFESFDEGPKFQTRWHGDPNCSGNCFQRSNLENCPVECECRWVRDLLVKLRVRMGRGG
jgi:hypothetical protein